MSPVDTAARSLPLTIMAIALLAGVAISGGIAMRMTWAGAIGLYFIVWWTALFAVLPFAARSQAELGEVTSGTDPGAPATPALRERAIWTTLVSGVIYLAVAWLLPLSGL